MYVKSLTAKSEFELANMLAAYIRRNFEVLDIVFKVNDNRPFVAFIRSPLDNTNGQNESLNESANYVINIQTKPDITNKLY